MNCHLVILPVVFCVPKVADGRDVFESYLRRILDWKQALDEFWLRTTIPERTAEILAEGDSYPVFPHIKALCNQLNIYEYSVHDITRVVNTILSQTPHFEQASGIQELLLSHCSLVCTAAGALKIDEYLQKIYISILVASQIKLDDEFRFFSIVSSTTANIIADATIEDIEYCPGVKRTIDVPAKFSGNILQTSQLIGLWKRLDLIRMWSQVVNQAEALIVFKARWLKEQIFDADVEFSTIEFPRVAIGKAFLQSASALGFLREEAKIKLLLDRVADIIIRRNLDREHRLRIGKGGNDPYRKRDADDAIRIDLDYEFHLHYWRLETGHIELANIVVHNDFSITE